MADDPPHDPIVETLRRYIRAHPRAFDSARGIREWWFAELPGPRDPDAVEAAIAILAAEGLLQPTQLPDGSAMWRAAAA